MRRRRRTTPQIIQPRAKILSLFAANDSARGSKSPPLVNLTTIQRKRLIVLRRQIHGAFRSRVDEVLHPGEFLQPLGAEQTSLLHFEPGALGYELLVFEL